MGFLQFSIWVWGSAWRPLPDLAFVGVSLKTTRERIFFRKDTVHISFINATDAGGFDLGYYRPSLHSTSVLIINQGEVGVGIFIHLLHFCQL